jgi:protein-tyrosine phosphatase
VKAYNKIIFVGESGTGRCVMAEAILKEYKLKRPMDITCRAFVALFPEPINQKVETVLISTGIVIEEHMSQQLSAQEFAEDTLVIVMGNHLREKILNEFPNANPENVQVLTHITGDELEIMNPYGQSLQAYGLCYETLNNSMKKLVEKLNEGD